MCGLFITSCVLGHLPSTITQASTPPSEKIVYTANEEPILTDDLVYELCEAILYFRRHSDRSHLDLIINNIRIGNIRLNEVTSQRLLTASIHLGSICNEFISFLLDNGYANVDYINEGGYTPLHCAVTHCNADAVRILLDHHANTDITDRTHNLTPRALALHFIAQSQFLEDSYTEVLNEFNKHAVEE